MTGQAGASEGCEAFRPAAITVFRRALTAWAPGYPDPDPLSAAQAQLTAVVREQIAAFPDRCRAGPAEDSFGPEGMPRTEREQRAEAALAADGPGEWPDGAAAPFAGHAWTALVRCGAVDRADAQWPWTEKAAVAVALGLPPPHKHRHPLAARLGADQALLLCELAPRYGWGLSAAAVRRGRDWSDEQVRALCELAPRYGWLRAEAAANSDRSRRSRRALSTLAPQSG